MKFTSRKTAWRFGIMLLVTGYLSGTVAQILRGRVIDEKSAGIEGATVELVVAALSATTGSDGSWRISVPLDVGIFPKTGLLPVPILMGRTLYFIVCNNNTHVKVRIHSLNGRFMYNAVYGRLDAGFYRLDPLKPSLNAGIYTACLQIGEKNFYFKLPVLNRTATTQAHLRNTNSSGVPGHLQKRMVVIDTLRVSKAGYAPAATPVTTYDDSLIITLKTFVPSYHLNPPHPCYNRFHVENCTNGDSKSACGGNCTVANSCSPPENPNKANLPKTFICPRFMLFSTEMLQAAVDDARLYGWNQDDPPFNYGVVGHDADVGGLDDVQSSCCQCYQLIFVTPEPSSPQPPDLPYPKPLVVQSFNTAASGPKGFDVFMGAGGYGAFNSCYKDPAFANTSKFNEFIYDNYPYQNPGGGGISFLRYPNECLKGWPPTVDAVASEACQKKIEQLCNQALVTASPQITADTRRSCIETNKVRSLYHQNWQVMAKRVRCPYNLTRVTGCRLKEDKLPLPLPKVQTPADARADKTFLEGYHTTTMQDCCKPTCAWADWIIDHRLPADGEWNSFYSCDKNGTPITK